MAVDAKQLTVTDDAGAWVRGRLLVVHRDEVGAMHRIAHGLVELQPRGNGRHGDAVARGALALRVARRAQVSLGIGLHPMLAKEIAIVNHVALGPRHFSGQVDVATTAIPRVPLALVRVTAEACGMLHARAIRVDGDVDVATHALGNTCLDVFGMGKAQMLSCHLGGVPVSRASVAVRARARVVGILMALDAIGRAWEV
ncbi:MAG: hypothetical protein AMS21_01470 [Gemmatimonas sp. SG8_38_2]|nr:MAG: hypothetical protein AMS21_01470 [Gemmatimonas sp. SG8_38_2]